MGRNVLIAACAAFVAMAPLALTGCLWNELDEFEQAKRAYRQCLGLHPGHPERCEAEKVRVDQRYSEYEIRAKTSWGCTHSGDECRPDHGPAH